jgi:integrase/recombinase XerD
MSNAVLHKFTAYLLTEKRVSTNTFDAYKRDIQQFVDWLTKSKITIEQVNLATLKQFLLRLKKDQLKARSMSRKISSLKAFYNYLNKYLGFDNIARELVFPKLEKRLPSYLSEEEIKKLLETADKETTANGFRNKIMLYLLYVSGMRISELISLRCSDIHFDTGFIAVQGKGGKGRMVPIPPHIMAMLKKYLETVLKSFVQINAEKRKTEYVFPVCYGGRVRPITRQAFWTILKQLAKKAGIDRPISPHKLRHSLATHMLKNGADLRSLQLLLGHENLSTVQIYTHLETGYLRKVYDKKHPRS